MRHVFLAIGLLGLIASLVAGGEPWHDLEPDQRARFRNPDGSCVQCSISMAAAHAPGAVVAPAEFLLWQSDFGPPVRGGSDPSRVRHYCEARNIPAWIITGHDEARRWTDWALATGRYAAIHWGPRHMITAVGRTVDQRGRVRYAVCDNNSPTRIDWYDEAEFDRIFGSWAVILKAPPPPGTPAIVAWWRD